MRKARLTTIALAVLLGVGAGLIITPAIARARAIAAIASPVAERRDIGWQWMLAQRRPNDTPRVDGALDAINARLATAGDDALRQGADVLRAFDRWGWAWQDPDLVVRELVLRSTDDAPDAGLLVVDALRTAPPTLDEDAIRLVVARLLRSDDPEVRAGGFAAACAWAGPARGAWLATLPVGSEDERLRRLLDLALSWCTPAPPAAPPDADASLAEREARLLRLTWADPEDATPLLDAHADDAAEPLLVMPDLLRFSADARAYRALKARAADGEPAAHYALQARLPHRDDEQARRVIDEDAEPPTVRRLAAWRWNRASLDSVRVVLALPPADETGEVYSAALLAERRLSRDEATTLAETWIRSLDDDEKRAGALLAALLGEHADLLAHAAEIEDIAEVRTTQRLALWALGVTTGPENPAEFAHRTLRLPDGDFRADVALCMLGAGQTEALALLTSLPDGRAAAYGRAVQKRAWLIERFVPTWHDAVGRPIGGSVRGIRLHFDHLEGARLINARRFVYDPDRGVFNLGE